MKIWLLLTFMIILLPFADATYITLQTSLQSSQGESSITITNKGDEPAYNLQLTLTSPSSIEKSEPKPSLDVNEEFSTIIRTGSSGLLPGTYPLILNIDYTDGNSYPFSAISVSLFNNKEATNPGLVTAIEPVTLSGSDKIKLKIKNLDETDKKLKIRIIVPKEITAEDEKLLPLAARDEASASFRIKDFSARPNSVYAVFAIIEYEQDGRHYTSISPTSVSIVKSLNVPANILITSLAVLLAIYIIYRVRRKNESKHSHPDIK